MPMPDFAPESASIVVITDARARFHYRIGAIIVLTNNAALPSVRWCRKGAAGGRRLVSAACALLGWIRGTGGGCK